MKLDVALCLPRDAKTVAVARRVVTSAIAELGVTETCVEAIRVALSEACSNVIRHSVAEDEYEVRLTIEDRRCEITVVDTGQGFDPASLPDQLPGPESPGGRGVALMRALVDAVEFDSQPARGTIVHLVKNLDLDPSGPLHTLLERDGS